VNKSLAACGDSGGCLVRVHFTQAHGTVFIWRNFQFLINYFSSSAFHPVLFIRYRIQRNFSVDSLQKVEYGHLASVGAVTSVWIRGRLDREELRPSIGDETTKEAKKDENASGDHYEEPS
jgi:hypothetical protein